jgi:DNA repair exonuclease SbcCD ATPase subunit
MFRALCGDDNLASVRIVTTNWSRVDEQEGRDREEALGEEIFKPLLDGGAKMLRHDNDLISAETVISELIPLPPITMQLERELGAGKKFNETSAGAVLTEEMTGMQEKHAEELAALQNEMQEAEEANNRALKAELEQDHRDLQRKIEKVENERRRLERTLAQARACLEARPRSRVQPEVMTQNHFSAPESARYDQTRDFRHRVRYQTPGKYPPTWDFGSCRTM